ncbi:hypothetical protein JZ751_020004 [Albula glossodonta]|uniref:Uncharacterized protein n=1 Tax=Albula glossodonta TaxID=121402 RepID=A0A8T2NT71_9TELE|nr:hypothetical protein JZ751_020004 [Albula glossodonta]
MTLNGSNGLMDYDERFEMLYSSIIKHNSSWTQTAMALSRSVRHRQTDNTFSSSVAFQARVHERRSHYSRSQSIRSAHMKSISAQKTASQPSSCRGDNLDTYDRTDLGMERQGHQRERGWREIIEGSGGSEYSILISDEGTGLEAQEEEEDDDHDDDDDDDDCRVMISPFEASDGKDDTLWMCDDNGCQRSEHELQDQQYGISVLDVGDDKAWEGRGIGGDADGCVDTLSTASGPTLRADFTLRSPCATCSELFRKMRKAKCWEKGLECDPMSLSCDQWVLKKTWKPKSLPSTKGNLSLCRKKQTQANMKSRQMRNKDISHLGPVKVGARQCRSRSWKKKKRRSHEVEQMEEGEEMQEEMRLDEKFSTSTLEICSEPILLIDPDRGSDDLDRARRKLDFSWEPVAPESQKQSKKHKLQNQQEVTKGTQSPRSAARRRVETVQSSPVESAPDLYPCVRNGGFKAMLARLEGNRSMVVQELDCLSGNKLRKYV